MTKVSDLKLEQVKVGLQVVSMTNPAKIGTVVKIDLDRDHYVWILWDGDTHPHSGWYGNDCECEVIMPPVEE